jgi:hypothetical protein
LGAVVGPCLGAGHDDAQGLVAVGLADHPGAQHPTSVGVLDVDVDTAGPMTIEQEAHDLPQRGFIVEVETP